MKKKLINLQQEQVEKLKDLGDRLRQFRQQKSISLEDVAVKTRIQARLLKALEEGNVDPLPEPIYIKGFITRYADAIGLNGAEFAKDFPIGLGIKFIKPSWGYVALPQLRPVHLYGAYVLVVIFAVNSLSYVVRRSALDANKLELSRQTNQPFNKNSQAQINDLQKSDLTTPEAREIAQIGKPVRVGVTLKAASWIRVVADGKILFEGNLPQGSQLTWVAKEQLTVKAKNAGGVLVAFNNEKAKKLGAPGQMQEVTFAAHSKS